jgi:hypothetical protein
MMGRVSGAFAAAHSKVDDYPTLQVFYVAQSIVSDCFYEYSGLPIPVGSYYNQSLCLPLHNTSGSFVCWKVRPSIWW